MFLWTRNSPAVTGVSPHEAPLNRSDIYSALRPVVEAFGELDIGYYIGGSIASSAHGLPRSTLDVDVIADLNDSHVEPLFSRLKETYYIDRDMMHGAIAVSSTFNLIHLATMVKIDVFVLKQDEYSITTFRRAEENVLESEHGPLHLSLASPEDTVLHKLLWYREGGSVSQQQRKDVVGVLRIQGDALDFAYLKEWAGELGVLDLLEQALEDIE